mmetsp:Transcript_71170/g.206108  ORF Transcript_71170/g.206108 Transcript_71170/m.206108 type:complete len:139 (-) Transcript_71170:94-510(-)
MIPSMMNNAATTSTISKTSSLSESASVEGYLTRELDIRFIDARDLANEAKIHLGITGYPAKHQCAQVKREAKKMFRRLSPEDQQNMRALRQNLDTFKLTRSKSDSYSTCDETESCSSRTSTASRTKRGWLRRTISSGK